MAMQLFIFDVSSVERKMEWLWYFGVEHKKARCFSYLTPLLISNISSHQFPHPILVILLLERTSFWKLHERKCEKKRWGLFYLNCN